MKRLLKDHQDWVLVVCALLFVAVLALFFVWGVQLLVTSIRASSRLEEASREVIRFNMEEAKLLLEKRGMFTP